MITWMQRHKKWLVITIWISTIAFVGAGFVGWGSYDYGSKGGAVAVVGEREISVNEYQREYSALYDQYAQIFGNQFNQEMADKLQLKDVAYKLAIQKNLILSFADELGLDVTNEEIAKQLVQMSAFLKDGKFDKDTYIKVLNQNRTNPTEFEAQLKRDLLLQKVEKIFNFKAQTTEIEKLNKLLFSEDDISIKILDSNSIKVNITEDDIKKYWESNKDNYLSAPSLKLDYAVVNLETNDFPETEISEYYEKNKIEFKKDDGKIKSFEEAKDDVIKALNIKETKKTALKEYLKIKKDEVKLSDSLVIEESKLSYGEENNKEILNAIPGDLLKPFFVDDKFIIVKVINKIPPKTLSYEEAKDLVTNDYKEVAMGLELEKVASKSLENFEGENIGYVSRNSFDKISGLNQQEAMSFLNELFLTSDKLGKISVGEKVVLYKINNSRFAQYDKSKDEAVAMTINNLINQELMTNLVKNLENRYEVQSSIKLQE